MRRMGRREQDAEENALLESWVAAVLLRREEQARQLESKSIVSTNSTATKSTKSSKSSVKSSSTASSKKINYLAKAREERARAIVEGKKVREENMQREFRTRSVILSRVSVDDQSVEVLWSACKFINPIRTVTLSGNPLDDCFLSGTGLESLIAAGFLRNVTELNLSHNDLRSGISSLSALQSLVKLTISHNGIDSEALSALCINTQPSVLSHLGYLDLSFNAIDPPGISTLRSALRLNESLRHLYLQGNSLINDQAADDLAMILKETTSLLVLDVRYAQLSKSAKEYIYQKGIRYNCSFVKFSPLDIGSRLSKTVRDIDIKTPQHCSLLI